MAEELELNLNGPDQTEPQAAVAAPPDQHIAARVGNIKDQVKQGMSNEELVQLLATAHTDKLIPWEQCLLPSEGRFYTDKHGNKWPDGTIRVRAMTQAAEKVLATQRLAETGENIDYLYRECCQFPDGFDPHDLLLGDRMFILFYLRGITHGNMYEFAVTCTNPECNNTSTQTYDLNELVGTIKRVSQSLADEPFKIKLPYYSSVVGREVWVSVRFLRGIDLNNMVAKRKSKLRTVVKPGNKSKNPLQRRMQQEQEKIAIDDSLTESMEQYIVNVMDVTDRMRIKQFVERMHSQDTATIREWMKDNTPGIDSTISVDCPSCKTNFTVELPITETFFRPTPAGRA